jgi:hypothetical protein
MRGEQVSTQSVTFATQQREIHRTISPGEETTTNATLHFAAASFVPGAGVRDVTSSSHPPIPRSDSDGCQSTKAPGATVHQDVKELRRQYMSIHQDVKNVHTHVPETCRTVLTKTMCPTHIGDPLSVLHGNARFGPVPALHSADKQSKFKRMNSATGVNQRLNPTAKSERHLGLKKSSD